MARQLWKPANILYPCPVVMVSCADRDGRPNIMTAAWTGTISSDPVMAFVSIRPARYSYQIIRDTGEFVLNLTTRDLAFATDFCGVRSGRDIDKFAHLGLHPTVSDSVRAPGIDESPVNIECKVVKIENFGVHDLFLAEVVRVSVDEQYMDEKGRFDLAKADLIAYSHGEYFALGEKVGKFGFSVKKDKKNKS